MASEHTPLTVSVTETESWSRRLSITVPRERVQRVRSSVASQLARNARLPGFRKGNLPASLIEKQFGRSIDAETQDRVINESFQEALQQEGLTPLSQPQLESVHYERGSDLTYEVAFEVQPALELARVGGFVIARPPEEVGDDEVESVLERLRVERAHSHPFDDERPDYGDEVVVEITELSAAAEGEGEGEDSAAEPEPRTFRFRLGEGQALPDIEDAIRTLEPGEWGEFDVRFPEDFPDEAQRGKAQRLRIQVMEAHRRHLPELDDAFAAEVGPFDSVDALRSRVRADLQAEARRRSEEQFRTALIDQIVEANGVEIPGSLVDRYADVLLEGMLGMVDEQGRRRRLPPEQEAQVSQLRGLVRPRAEALARQRLIVDHLAAREGLRATQDELDARVEEIAGQHGRSPSDLWVELEKSGQLESLEGQLTEEKVFQYLRSQNNFGG
ncbi:MAG TPA: trigger factor [Longimicrobiaceae bacterium]|nr:trigger factor [Longimicrobiaceae bacterium]